MMLLLDDDVNCAKIDNKKLVETSKISELFPIKPVVCKFFKPKLKGSNHSHMAGGNRSSTIQLEEICITSKHPKSQSRSQQNFMNGEGLMQTEIPYQYFSSTDSSSFSNLPSISVECSKTSESFSDSDNQDPDESGVTTLIVKNVYSLCRTNQSKNEETNLSNLSNECCRSCNNKITVTKKSKRKKSHLSKRKSKTKFIEKFSLLVEDKEKPDLNVSDSELSDTPTEAMTLDINDFDLPTHGNKSNLEQPVHGNKSNLDLSASLKKSSLGLPVHGKKSNLDLSAYGNKLNLDLMQPVVLLDRFEPERIAPHLFPDHETLRLTINLKSKSLVARSTEKSSSFLPNSNETTIKIRKSSLSAANKTNHNSIENDILYCLVCNQSNNTACCNHPVKWIPNAHIDCPHVEYVVDKSFDKYRNESQEKSYCNCNGNELEHIQNNLPHMFQLKESENSDIGVWTKQLLLQGTVIGPYLGKIIENSEQENLMSKPYFTRGCSQSGLTGDLHCLQFAFKSNWLRCVRFTDNYDKANLKIYQYDAKIFFQAIQDISSHSELLLFNEPHLRIASTANGFPSLLFPTLDIQNVSFEDRANQDALIMKIRKLYLDNSRLTVVDIIGLLRCEHPDLNDLNENELAEMIDQLRPGSASRDRTKIDDKITEFITKLLRDCPQITSTEIIPLIEKRFPNVPRLSKDSINRLIRIRGLRPLLGIDDKADLETVQSIVSMVTRDTALSVKDVQQMLQAQFPSKPELDCKSIENVIKINFCRLHGSKFRQGSKRQVDQEVLKEIRKLVYRYDCTITRLEILEKLKEQLPENRNINIDYIRYLMRKFGIKVKPPQFQSAKGIKPIIY